MKKTPGQLELIAALLRQETTLSLATTGDDGEASVAPLFYFVDEALSLYWLSDKNSRHSLNLGRSSRAAATVYRNALNWKEIRGVQMRGSAAVVTDPQRRDRLIEAYCERFKLGRVLRLAARQSTLYVFEPQFFRYIDNAKGFGSKFELTLHPEGWRLTRSK
jgi:uncharacterized protein YhbP (UPF0306 family)